MSGIFKPFTRQNNLSRSSVSSGLGLIREGRRRENQTWNRPDYSLVRAVGSDAVKRLTLVLGVKFARAWPRDEDRSRTQWCACGSAAWPALKHSHRGISSEEATSRGGSDVFCRSANGPNEDCGTDCPSYHQTLMRGQMFSYNFTQEGKKGNVSPPSTKPQT